MAMAVGEAVVEVVVDDKEEEEEEEEGEEDLWTREALIEASNLDWALCVGAWAWAWAWAWDMEQTGAGAGPKGVGGMNMGGGMKEPRANGSSRKRP